MKPDCKICSAIKFFNARTIKTAEIYQQVTDLQESAMSNGMMQKWVRQFNERETNIRDKQKSRLPSVAIDNKSGEGIIRSSLNNYPRSFTLGTSIVSVMFVSV